MDAAKADLLRAEVLGITTVPPQQVESQAQLLSAGPSNESNSPPADSKLSQDESQDTLPNRAMPSSAAARLGLPKQIPTHVHKQATSGDPTAAAHSKKRKADKADVTAEAAAEEAEQVNDEPAVSAQQEEEGLAPPKQTVSGSGNGKRKKQGTLQDAFAKAKVPQTCIHCIACITSVLTVA